MGLIRMELFIYIFPKTWMTHFPLCPFYMDLGAATLEQCVPQLRVLDLPLLLRANMSVEIYPINKCIPSGQQNKIKICIQLFRTLITSALVLWVTLRVVRIQWGLLRLGILSTRSKLLLHLTVKVPTPLHTCLKNW